MPSELTTWFDDSSATTASANATSIAPEGPTYQIEFREEGRQPQLVQLPLPEVLYIQQALEQSGAIRRFRRMKIELYRKLPNGGGHRLDIPFDRSKRRIPSAGDYAIHPNDRIVVTEDASTIVDEMLDTLGQPFEKSRN
jgi:hypothetical protein